MLLVDALRVLLRRESLHQLSLSQVLSFVTLASSLKRSIQLMQPSFVSSTAPPIHLPRAIVVFLARATSIPLDEINYCWLILKDTIWQTLPEIERQQASAEVFRTFGWPLGITAFSLYPPTNHCSNPDCPRTTELRKAEPREVIIHTLAGGSQPAWTVHLYCPACNHNYHHNYYVQDGLRTYYPGIPNYLQVSEHHFVETRIVEMWTNQLLFGSCSATNCGKIYMTTFSPYSSDDLGDINWPFSPALTTEHAWDGFVLLALLRDHAERHLLLTVPHTGLQHDRFHAAMRERNERIIHFGQPEVAHYCDGCMRVYEDSQPAADGTTALRKCQVVVSDGITLGHPCCGVLRCTEPLQNNRHRYCQTHYGLHNQCAVLGCEQPVSGEDSKTCDDPVHCRMETLSVARGKSAFALSSRLQRQYVANPNDAIVTTAITEPSMDADLDDDLEENNEWFTTEQGTVKYHFEKNEGCVGVRDDIPAVNEALPATCPKKSNEGNRRLKAQFGRRRTHNEQTLVRPCGIILARATFFGAEAVSNVLEFTKRVFSVPGAQKPEHFIYDTACDAKQQAEARGDEWWQGVGMCVDVWHLLNKHKTTHDYCQKNCNSADYPELMKDDGSGWWFNTSIAEQVNVWLGGYHAICREMVPVKYNFFLDEMIRLRNVLTVDHLRKRNMHPRHAPSV